MSSTTQMSETGALPVTADPGRLEVLRRTGVADGRSDEVFDRFARLAATLLDAPVSYVSLVGHDRQVMPGAVALDGGGERRTLALEDSVCAFSVATGDELVIEDMATDPLVRDNDRFRDLDYAAYAGYPLTTEDGYVLGNLCVVDRSARHWSEEEMRSLRELSALVVQELEHRITRSRLDALRDEVVAVLAEVPPTHEAVRLLSGAADRSEDPRLQRLAATASARADRLVRAASAVHEDMAAAPVATTPAVRGRVDLVRTVRRTVQGTRAATGADLRLETDPALHGTEVDGDVLALERALSHVMLALLHHSGDAVPTVTLERDGDLARLTLATDAGHLPTGQLGRAVGRLAAAVQPVGQGAGRPTGVRLVDGAVRAVAGDVEGEVSPEYAAVRAVMAVHDTR
ncbi:GAF domain-containing protein [Aquipuribacter nitratireducens]|uniref:GAF domain-containing protein n=1 Tax=Aquipuribacter nitratireducens TaxID=650104 RepID=A0ABW0GMK2_9MICO